MFYFIHSLRHVYIQWLSSYAIFNFYLACFLVLKKEYGFVYQIIVFCVFMCVLLCPFNFWTSWLAKESSRNDYAIGDYSSPIPFDFIQPIMTKWE
jgi:polyferredoxin